jgi:glutamine synthetase
MAILDGINKALAAKKTPAELEKSVSKKYGETDFYLEKNRVYRVENDIFADYSAKEREKLFGKSPATVWEVLSLFDENPEKTKLLFESGVMRPVDLDSFKTAALRLWVTELSERLIPKMRETCHTMGAMHHKDAGATDLDEKRWAAIDKARREIAQDFSKRKSLLTTLSDALDAGKYGEASKLALTAFAKMSELEAAYANYQKNLFMW